MILPRFYPILDTRVLAACGVTPYAAADVILRAGARILQFRHKGDFDRDTFTTAERIAELCREHAADFVVNDRPDFAMLLGAAVHLGQEDLPPDDARRIMGTKAQIGFSTHNERQFRIAVNAPVNYLAFGPVFMTSSKDRPDPVTGTEELRRLRPLTSKPVVGIGGITRGNAREVLEAGADSVAVIRDIYGENAAAIGHAAEAWLRTVNAN